MDKQIHIIWGNSSFSDNRINALKMSGTKRILVLDSKQNSVVKERNDVVYFSHSLASLLRKDEPETIHHLLIFVPPGKYRKGNKRR